MKGKARFGFIFAEDNRIVCRECLDLEGLSLSDAKLIFMKFKRDTMESHIAKFGDATTEDLASILNVSTATIQNWVKKNNMPYLVKSAKGYRFNREQSFQWIRENKPHYGYLITRYEERMAHNGE